MYISTEPSRHNSSSFLLIVPALSFSGFTPPSSLPTIFMSTASRSRLVGHATRADERPQTGQGDENSLLRANGAAALVGTHVEPDVEQAVGLGLAHAQLGRGLDRGLQARHPADHDEEVAEGLELEPVVIDAYVAPLRRADRQVVTPLARDSSVGEFQKRHACGGRGVNHPQSDIGSVLFSRPLCVRGYETVAAYEGKKAGRLIGSFYVEMKLSRLMRLTSKGHCSRASLRLGATRVV